MTSAHSGPPPDDDPENGTAHPAVPDGPADEVPDPDSVDDQSLPAAATIDVTSGGDPPQLADVASRRKRRLRRIGLVAALVLAVSVAVTGASYAWVRIDAGSHQFTVSNAPEAPVGIVFGAGIRSDGTPTPALRVRLDDAVALYRAEKVKVLLVSGDNGTVSHDEPTVMRDYLVGQGVPSAKVVLDYAGFDTWDTCARAHRIFGVSRALVVTQEFHLPRAVFLCRQAGIDADGVANPHPEENKVKFQVREVPAAIKAAWDAIWQPDPKFLGKHEVGVEQALGG